MADLLFDDSLTADRARRFGGVARLYGDQALSRFERSHVAIVGLGGVGSWAAEALARSAIGALTLIDLDHVAESNTNRQLHALDGNYGKSKAQAMAERIVLIDPACRVTVVEDFLEAHNVEQLLGGGFDFVIDAIDAARHKTALIAWCVAHRQPVITVGAAGGQTDPTRVTREDLALTVQDPLLAKVRNQLRREHHFARGKKARFRVPAVYSSEPVRYPITSSSDDAAFDAALAAPAEPSNLSVPTPLDTGAVPSASGPAGLSCAGFGSSVCVTAVFGFAAAAHVLNTLAAV
ncbi:MAG: tRNA threonylcarbamoyladenosine dehydratase [Janthinobacterium lividum]